MPLQAWISEECTVPVIDVFRIFDFNIVKATSIIDEMEHDSSDRTGLLWIGVYGRVGRLRTERNDR